MNFEPEIEFYSDGMSEPVYEAIVARLNKKQRAQFLKKVEYYRNNTLTTLLQGNVLDPIEGIPEKLYEFKVKGVAGIVVRFVCALRGRTLLLLNVFFTSGSRGQVMRHVPVAVSRLRDFKAKNQHHEI